MWSDLLTLFGGWYEDYVSAIRSLIEYTVSVPAIAADGSDLLYEDVIVPSVWSAFVPWEHLIAFVVLITFTICIFKLLRTVLCRIL